MSKEEKCGCNCSGHHEISTDDIARHNNIIMNAIVKVLINKKIIEADDINKAVEELQNLSPEKE
jgi:hypothetical protein